MRTKQDISQVNARKAFCCVKNKCKKILSTRTKRLSHECLTTKVALQRLGSLDAIDAAITGPRDPSSVVHSHCTLPAQRVFAIALGYEDLNDQQTMRMAPALQVASGVTPDESEAMASASTQCRLENRISRQTDVTLSKILMEQFLLRMKRLPKRVYLTLIKQTSHCMAVHWPVLPQLLSTLLLSASLCSLRGPASGFIPSSEQ